MAVGSTSLKALQTFLYSLAFGCAVVILALYSYFLAIQSGQNVGIPNKQRAVEGIAGSAVLYTILAVLFTCCLGGIIIFAFLAIVLDLLFAIAFIAVAIMTRDGAGKCSGNNVKSPLGQGPQNSRNGRGGVRFGPTLRTACIGEKACFAVAILAIFVFLISAFVQVWIGRRHHREKRYGPSPANNYTSGSGIKWYKRRRGAKSAHAAAVKEATPTDTAHNGVTGTNGTELGQYEAGAGDTFVGHKYENQPHAGAIGQDRYHGGYHTAPAGAAVNPYTFENAPGQARSHA